VTPTALIFIVAGCLLLLAVVPLLTYAWWPRPRRREPETRSERPRTPTREARLRRAVWLRLVPWRDGAPAHQGATEGFGAELRALRHAPVAPELVTDVETEARWAALWHDFEQGLQAQVGGIFDRARAALMAPLDAETCMRLEAASWPTGQFSDAEVAELGALLAGEDRELVRAG
jgi:hypothetical protein